MLIWSWWAWALAAWILQTLGHPFVAAALALLAVAAYVGTPSERGPIYGLDHEFSIEADDFLPTITGAIDTPFSEGSRLEILNNGDQFFPAMIEAIGEASESVTMEAYIYWEGNIGRLFAGALAAKAQQGVPVKILLDAVGSATIGTTILEMLESGGCVVRWYRPLQWYTLNRINNRTHRKSLIVDGHIGFTGGAGIADHWTGNAENPSQWRDIQVRIEGPAVVPLQSGFARNWLETTNELLSGPRYYPAVEPAGSLQMQTILSSPETGSSNVRIMYYLSIVCARKRIWIANPYFIPGPAAIDILVDAKKRGVDVKVMLMGKHHDNKLARWNSRRLYGPLLRAGIEIYEYNRTFLHHKVMICDGIWCTVGTTNFDSRSFALNEESSVCVYDRGVARQFEEIFRDDLRHCEQVRLRDWRGRSPAEKLTEQVASVLQDQA
jgi:cardiolipin synthase